MNVLVVDDDVPTAQLLADILELRGHRVIAAGTGAGACWVLQHVQPDLVLLDLILPDCDGLTLLPRLTPAAPVIVLSARESDVDRVLCRHLGAADYVTKPFDLDDLEARVDAVMAVR
jgi:two-component system OmpR family response regulator